MVFNSSSKKNFSSPNAGLSSSSHAAFSLYSAKKGLAAQSGFLPWRKRSVIIFLPAASATPSNWIFPGVALMLGPLTVLQIPLTCWYAFLKMFQVSTSGTENNDAHPYPSPQTYNKECN